MTTKAKHTPGPWRVSPYLRPDFDDDPVGVGVYKIDLPGLTDRYFGTELGTDHGEAELDAVYAENRANTHLIAAAPDLLAAAEAILESPDLCLDALERKTVECIENLRAAIRRAKGEV